MAKLDTTPEAKQPPRARGRPPGAKDLKPRTIANADPTRAQLAQLLASMPVTEQIQQQLAELAPLMLASLVAIATSETSSEAGKLAALKMYLNRVLGSVPEVKQVHQHSTGDGTGAPITPGDLRRQLVVFRSAPSAVVDVAVRDLPAIPAHRSPSE
jgi:hypothetical protein